MMTYVTDSMKTEMASHVLIPVEVSDNFKLYTLNRPGTIVYSVYIAEFARRLCLSGDICLGGNDRGIVSSPGYGVAWFSGHLAESYLCQKFLREEWQWDVAVRGIKQHIEDDRNDGEGLYLENEHKLDELINNHFWEYDEPNQAEYYEYMTSIGHDGCELPGFDYPRMHAGWLCAIQQRFSELFKHG